LVFPTLNMACWLNGNSTTPLTAASEEQFSAEQEAQRMQFTSERERGHRERRGPARPVERQLTLPRGKLNRAISLFILLER